MRTTTDGSQFGNAWLSHINELSVLAVQAGITWEDYSRVTQELRSWVSAAVQAKREALARKVQP